MERGWLVATLVRTRVPVVTAALLLEVVVSLAILVSALGFLGAQLVGGMELVRQAELRTQGIAFVDRVLAFVEFDPEMQKRLLQEQTADGDFGEQYPGWFWQIQFEPITDVAGLGLVRITVYCDENASASSSIASARPVAEVALLKAARGELDLVRDFGMTEEEAAEFAASLPGEIDPHAVDPQVLVKLVTENPELVLDLLPSLMPILEQFLGGDVAGQIGQFAPPGTPAEELGDAFERVASGPPFDTEGGTGGVGVVGGKGGQTGGGIGGPGGGRGEFRGPRSRPQPAVGGPPPGARRSDVGREGAQPGTPPTGAGQPRYTIEDLMRMREQLQSKGGG